MSSHAIIMSLPRSSSELIPLIIATTQEHWGSDQVIFKDNIPLTSAINETGVGKHLLVRALHEIGEGSPLCGAFKRHLGV